MAELFKRRRRLTIELLTIVVVYAITVASYQMWWAGSAAPARFLVAILPLAVLPIAVVASGSLRPLVVLLLLVSASLIFPRAFVEGGRLIFNSRGSFDPTLEWLSQMVNLPLALPSVHRDGGSIAIRDGIVWLAALLVGGVAARVFKRNLALNWTLTPVALAVSAMIATTVVWSLHHVSPVTADRSKLAAMAAYRPAWQSPAFLERISIEVPRAVRLDRVPAGDYEITPGQSAIAFVGRNDSPITDPQLGTGPFHLRLPVSLQTLNIRVEQPSTLRPISVIRPAVSRNAVRATRYGRARAFVFDEWAYLEPDGFWTRANGTAEVVLDTDDATARQSGLPISITAGAVDTTIELSTGGLHETFSLTPGQRQDVVLPPAESGAWPLRIRSGAGFRPSERDPGSRDVRMLAAWITVR
jgi:hypothetical protein